MKVLVGCEESQIVTRAFRKLGHIAFSCDLVQTRGNPNWHIQGDIEDFIVIGGDLVILHVDCTAMALSGNRWYGVNMPRHDERLKAIDRTMKLWEKAKKYFDRVCLENPMSVIFQYLNADIVQYVQPHQFGHGEKKKTGLALHNLPELISTNEVDGREERIWKMAPGPNRKRDRSVTYQGIADAMAEQWGNLI